MYIYHALIATFSTHTIHINLNTIFYTHEEHSPTNAIYIKYYLILKQQGKKHTQTTPKQTNKQTCKCNQFKSFKDLYTYLLH